jgi:excisionase family DNA binding protein
MVTMEKQLLSVAEAAKRLGVNVKTLRGWADNGLFPVVRLPNGYRRFERAVVEEKRREMGFTQDSAEG